MIPKWLKRFFGKNQKERGAFVAGMATLWGIVPRLPKHTLPKCKNLISRLPEEVFDFIAKDSDTGEPPAKYVYFSNNK